MKRRHFLGLLGGLGLVSLGAAAVRFWPQQGVWNPCPSPTVPANLLQHEVVQAAWQGIDPARVWDSHCHLAGSGDSGSGAWMHPDMDSPLHPIRYIQLQFYLNAACVDEQADSLDRAYVRRLRQLQQGFHPRSRALLLAFDYRHDAQGRPQPQQSTLFVPNDYAAELHRRYPERFEWIASIHPYREDCVEALDRAVSLGARAVKWLPSVMGIDPASRRCDPFYAALKRHDLPLLTHAGSEYALQVLGSHQLNHPLRLRYPLDQGVKVIVAHCASIGTGPDLDKGPHGEERPNIDFFARLMADRHYDGLLFGDIAAITQINRRLEVLRRIFTQQEWHGRLLNGSDYPLPGVMPLFSLQRYVDSGALSAEAAGVLSELRPYNPLLFDFVLKRSLAFDGARLAPGIFETAGFFLPA